MKRIALFLWALAAILPLAAADSGRIVQNFNFGWRFHAGDVEGAQAAAFDDSGWQEIVVPHDFQIYQPWVAPAADEKADNSDIGSNVKSRLSSRGFKEMGIGWYRKTFTPADSLKGKRILLDFEGIMLVGDVYLNGERIGGTEYGYLGFDADVSKLLKFGQENVVAVKANTQRPENSRWYTGGGLYRDVKLIVTDPQQHFTRHPLYITTPSVSEAKATVMVQAEMACYLRVKDLMVNTKIVDPAGNVVYEKTNAIHYNRGQKVNEYIVDSITLESPKLWSCETPNLYEAVVTLYRPDGTVADQVSEHFGVRWFEYSPAFGFKLNGKKVLFMGNANHHTLGALGAAAYPRAMEKRIQLLKEFGFNHIRTSHNPYSESFLDLCDKYGMLVVDELYDKWLTQYAGGRTEWLNLWQHDVPEFIKRDRNHPSVVMWSLGNELQQYWSLPFADWGVTPYRLQRELLMRYDKTRPVTVAMHPRTRSLTTDSIPAPLALVTDIASYNYRYMYFPGDSRRFPNMIFYQSEANNSMMGPNFFEMDLDKVVGLAYWGMIDYLGESNGWPAKGWVQGAFDIALDPKPKAYLLRSMFKPDEPVVHIGIVDSESNAVWNDIVVGSEGLSDHWNRKEGSTLSLYTYTNADEVELFVNGKSLGVKQNTTAPKSRNRIKWDGVKYEPGYVEAVAKKGGKVVARHKIETAGDAVKLTAESDNPEWKADGQDLSYVLVELIDEQGNVVFDNERKIRFTCNGKGRVIATGNASPNDMESFRSDSPKFFKGRAMIILKSNEAPGNLQLNVSSEGIQSASLQIKVE